MIRCILRQISISALQGTRNNSFLFCLILNNIHTLFTTAVEYNILEVLCVFPINILIASSFCLMYSGGSIKFKHFINVHMYSGNKQDCYKVGK